MYEYGKGVPQNYPEAMKWYLKAARQGNVFAQNSVGHLYLDCKGVEQDFSTAKEWFFRAADQGYPAAQCNLGLSYR